MVQVAYCLPGGAASSRILPMRSSMVSRLMRDRVRLSSSSRISAVDRNASRYQPGCGFLHSMPARSLFGEMPDMSAEKFRGGQLFELVFVWSSGRQLAWIFQLVFTGKLIEYLPHGQAMPKVTVTPQHLEDFEGGVPCIGFALRRLVCIHTLRLPRASSRMERGLKYIRLERRTRP